MPLAGNGGLTVGADLDQALARAWCLEDRAGSPWPRATGAGRSPPRPWTAHLNLAAARTSSSPGVVHSSTTRIPGFSRYQTRCR